MLGWRNKMILNYKTRGNSSPKGKQYVFFACYPIDFNLCFLTIVNEILEKQNCAIWYLTDYDEIDATSLKEDLALMQLIIVPITENLLLKDSYVSKIVLPYALEKHIPVCPIVFEDNLSSLISQESYLKFAYVSLFGDWQYLNRYSNDSTEIPYFEKLSSYLSKVLIGDELTQKIRSAFDAYIFMSYRKKDRKYAQKLMQLIHKNEFCKKIAIWYDEFLVPGEGFNQAIADVLQNSELFALVVTPNLVNEINYVMTTEYPEAREADKLILPVEMVETDKDALKEKFDGLPDCISASKNTDFVSRLQSVIEKITLKENEGTSEHKFFLGLAYLNGIDVEINFEIGISNIEVAAQDGLPEAMEKLTSIYRFGIGTTLDYDKAIYWQSHLVEVYFTQYNQNNSPENVESYSNSLYELGHIYEEKNDTNNAIAAFIQLDEFYTAEEKYFSKSNFYCKKIRVLYLIANLYAKSDDFESQHQAFSFYRKIISILEERAKRSLINDELAEIANFYDMLAMFLINVSRRFDSKIDVKELSLSSRRLRRVIECNHKIDFAGTLKDSVFHYGTARGNARFLNESGIAEAFKNLGSEVDPEVDFKHIDPLMEAEELLFLSLRILEYLGRIDFERYRKNYSTTFCHIADLWMMLSYAERAIETYNLNIKVLEKYSAEYFQNLDEEIATSQLQLGKAFILVGDYTHATVALEKAITLFERYQEPSLRISIILADAYRQMAIVKRNGKNVIQFLNKERNMLEKVVESKFSTLQLTMRLAKCYCEIAKICTAPDSWDSELFFTMFDKVNQICKKNYDEDKINCSIYLNTIYLLRTFMEDCKTVKSVEFVIKFIQIAINNCKTLLVEDSEFNYDCWIQAINQIDSFNHYAVTNLQGEILETWQISLAHLVTEYLNFITDFAIDNTERLLPYNFRVKFTDFALDNGTVNSKFIENYETILYLFFEILIKNVYKEGLLVDSVDIKKLISDVYDDLINGQQQSYLLQIMSKEKHKLIDLLERF